MNHTPLQNYVKWGALALVLSLSACGQRTTTQSPEAATTTAENVNTATENTAPASAYQIPVDYYTLDNGLKVVLSQDKTAPLATIAVYYNIGFRIEPKDRTGFAHLFEHMMFQGSENLGKMEFIQLVQKNGGILNGSTRFDFTNYFEIVPAHKLETMLWAEADRMKGLNITQENLTNQQGVVKNEVKVNVLNQPYGGFPWLDMPQYANKNWYNAHNFYGDLEDLDAASLEDVQSFFDTYYSPNNAVLVVVGDFETSEAKHWIQQYFAGIPSGDVPSLPDLSEPRQEKEQRFTKDDKLANRPALAFAYHMPERNSPEYYAMGLLDQILLQGNDSRLYQALVQERGYASSVDGGINAFLGNMFNYNGPMLWMGSLIHDQNVNADEIVKVVDAEIQKLQQEGIDQELIDLAIVKMRSSLYDQVSASSGFGKADLLATFALFDDDPSRINRLESEFRKVTPELLRKTIEEYLRPTNRTVLVVNPLAKS
ncbi:pitrilysin family protein [Pontibacter sp. BAB1700]|uniref:M16 family metallopeptidase n=1 Tax=Pontibacter sp. BAB1700 TaxID=1144253 RepID=UPI00026BE160|nr:pitrilysin family protein [Pontibacter sp. BAB1700]EJF08379.1 peptidase [Pontibacter sp. BAB1700]